jgi:hypothetical protein
MESDYNKKDLKSSPKVKVVEEGIIKKDGKFCKDKNDQKYRKV